MDGSPEARRGPDPLTEIREFRAQLRKCTEGALLGGESADLYSEEKFEQVRALIARFKGREGFADHDRQWTVPLTDVRNWFVFNASERWRDSDQEHETYADSDGKSGGQKEKLAYTILAASLAYQFRLDGPGGSSTLQTLPASRVVVVENEITFLALPDVRDAIAFFGAGFDALRLGRIPWLRGKDVVYWGDLDTDGFVILDRLRGQLPQVRSILMDLDTLTAHESQWTTDPTPSRATLDRLTPDEAVVHRILRDNDLGTSVRLEQERVNFARVRFALATAWPGAIEPGSMQGE